MNILITLSLLICSIIIMFNNYFILNQIVPTEVSELSFSLSILLGLTALMFVKEQTLWRVLITACIFFQCLGGTWIILTGTMSNIYLLIPLLLFFAVLYGIFNLQKPTHNGEL